MLKKKKIICTIGPSSLNPNILRGFKDRGVDFLRVNLSHTSEEYIEEVILELKKYDIPIIIDTEGPQIRTGNNYEIHLKQGKGIKIYNKKILCDENNLFLTPLDIIEKMRVGDIISPDFNSALLNVRDISYLEEKGYILCKVITGGKVGGKKAIHIENINNIKLPAFSNKDLKSIDIAKKYNVNTFTLSFIDNKEDLIKFKKIYPESVFYAKIETKKAVDNLDEIINYSNGILIDRGDLSREVPIEKIPLFQKYIIYKTREKEKDVFVATNTLEKMVYSMKPEKSEVNDIVNTLLDGATGIALTKETAVGNYPLETVSMLSSIMNQINYLELNEDSTKKELIETILKKII